LLHYNHVHTLLRFHNIHPLSLLWNKFHVMEAGYNWHIPLIFPYVYYNMLTFFSALLILHTLVHFSSKTECSATFVPYILEVMPNAEWKKLLLCKVLTIFKKGCTGFKTIFYLYKFS
jgi:hypothetical protein